MDKKNKDAPPATKQDKGISKQSEDYSNNVAKDKSSIFEWATEYELTQQEADEISNPTWIIENLIIMGHIVLIPAEPNGGKTTIMFHEAGCMAKDGYEVYYVNSDISGGDAKPMVQEAKDNGFLLMLPDMKQGKSMDTVFKTLIEMAATGDRYDNVVFVFDTLKKIINVIQKHEAKNLFKLLRKLSAKGMTIILLAHTNKYKDDEGMPIYEGTGDMRSDVDDLIYLIPQKHDDGSMTVTTMPDKMRGAFNPISFNIDPKRKVTLLNKPVDTAKANSLIAAKEKDEEIINSINAALSRGKTTQKDIIEYCDEEDAITERKVKRALNRYSYFSGGTNKNSDQKGKIWKKVRGSKNSYIFSMI